MKLDTTGYYPSSPLDEEASTTPDQQPAAEESSAYQSAIASAEESTPRPETPDPMPIAAGDMTEVERFLTGVSNFLSWIFVPLMMPVYGAIIAFTLSILSFNMLSVRVLFIGLVAGINLMLPISVIIILKRVGVLSDYGVNRRSERSLPYLIGIVCLIATAVLLYFKHAPLWFVAFYVGGALAGIIELLVNLRWKISAHAAGVAGVVALLSYLVLYDFTLPSAFGWLVASVAIAGLVGSARILLGKHSVWQVLAGYAVGFAAVYIPLLVLAYHLIGS
ncbi:MAG: phosphatase PAP2 family protein [Muribaculaceae bacterium]|nr:phosphatase PAP2 family protein [Muribaculaceae bacterium]MDY5388045.1 phosphatase PAP2 family protein [Muribaculaceae bacterium]